MFKWEPLELFASENKLISVRYKITATDGKYSVESEGNLTFLPDTVSKPFSDITEADIVHWIEKDTTNDGINLIKCNLEEQIQKLKIADELAINKVDMPWLAGTFTIQ